MSQKDIIKELLEKFFIAITVCTVITIIVAGKVAVGQSGRQMIEGESYASVFLENGDKTFNLYNGDNVFSFNKGMIELIVEIKKEIKLTPFGAFVKTVREIVPSA